MLSKLYMSLLFHHKSQWLIRKHKRTMLCHPSVSPAIFRSLDRPARRACSQSQSTTTNPCPGWSGHRRCGSWSWTHTCFGINWRCICLGKQFRRTGEYLSCLLLSYCRNLTTVLIWERTKLGNSWYHSVSSTSLCHGTDCFMCPVVHISLDCGQVGIIPWVKKNHRKVIKEINWV